MVVNFSNSSWKHMHVTFGVFEVQNIVSATMEN
jgi:hypothetical protein